jgi:hypothetical protein
MMTSNKLIIKRITRVGAPYNIAVRCICGQTSTSMVTQSSIAVLPCGSEKHVIKWELPIRSADDL